MDKQREQWAFVISTSDYNQINFDLLKKKYWPFFFFCISIYAWKSNSVFKNQTEQYLFCAISTAFPNKQYSNYIIYYFILPDIYFTCLFSSLKYRVKNNLFFPQKETIFLLGINYFYFHSHIYSA